MLGELWSNYLAFDICHLDHIVTHLLDEKYGPGLKTILSAYTTDVLVSSMKPENIYELVSKWVKKAKDIPEMQADLDIGLQHSYFALPALNVLLEGEPTKAQIEGLSKVVKEFEYYHFKYSSVYDALMH